MFLRIEFFSTLALLFLTRRKDHYYILTVAIYLSNPLHYEYFIYANPIDIRGLYHTTSILLHYHLESSMSVMGSTCGRCLGDSATKGVVSIGNCFRRSIDVNEAIPE